MFTGIINSIGTIIKIKKKADKIFFIETKLKLSDLKVGSSISCSGVCLTIIQKGKKKITVGSQFLLLKKHYQNLIFNIGKKAQ